MSNAVIVVSDDGPEFYGANMEFRKCREPEAILAGPYETGKTYAALYKLHDLLCLNPKSQALMVRKTQKAINGSAVVTYRTKVLPMPPDNPDSPVKEYGGAKPEFFDYPNGSRLTVGGMDNPDKFLSAEYDFIYVNQAEELRLDDWEKLTGRATGRAGNAPWTQVMADCNPGPPTHWILKRDRLKRFNSQHEDNPMLFNHATGEWTAQGKRTLETLDALTGIRKKRGKDGLWVAAEGQVYEYSETLHLVDPFEIPEDWRRIRVCDFGYTNPFVCTWWAFDGDGRMYLYRELYMSQRTVRRHAEQINTLSQGENIEATIADHDAEDRATLEEHGIYSIAADKPVSVGIEKVEDRLAKAGDGKPRLFFFRDALVEHDAELDATHRPACTVDEFASYVYPQAPDGKPVKEAPVKMDDHGMDAMRYAVMYADGADQWLVS